MESLANTLSAIPPFVFLIQVIVTFCAGLIPVLVWLWFWEHEDKNPEPKKLIFYAFLAGMLATVATLPFEMWAYRFMAPFIAANDYMFPLLIVIWASIEELLKFAAAYIFVLRRTENDEPIDSMMYMITVALGFAALENMFFIFSPIFEGKMIEAIMLGNMRFVGATLLHTIASGSIGFMMALAFYRSKKIKRLYVSIGVITAIILHAAFNLSIMNFEESYRILPFYAVWIAIVVILLAFEKIKGIAKPSA